MPDAQTPETPKTTETPETSPSIADFVRGKNVAPETQIAFKNFMGSADPLAMKPSGQKVSSLADPQRNPEAAEEQLEAAIKQINEAPEKTYQERLKEHGITLEDAHKIVDTILTTGVYEKAYPVTSQISATFRSRTLADQERIQEMIEEQAPQFIGSINIIMSKCNLAASLVEFAGNRFGEDEFDKAMKFIKRLPHVLFNVLITKLSLFDELVITVMDEGSIENF